jgi:hypothetical protein
MDRMERVLTRIRALCGLLALLPLCSCGGGGKGYYDQSWVPGEWVGTWQNQTVSQSGTTAATVEAEFNGVAYNIQVRGTMTGSSGAGSYDYSQSYQRTSTGANSEGNYVAVSGQTPQSCNGDLTFYPRDPREGDRAGHMVIHFSGCHADGVTGSFALDLTKKP